MVDDGCKIRCLCFDRTCELVPFLKNLAKKKNEGAEILLKDTLFMVDNFHIKRHTTKCCMPPPDKNPSNLYHPKCSKFSDFADVNTSIAESVFAWIKSHRRSVRMMTEEKFQFFIHIVISLHNKYIKQSSDNN